MASGACQVGRDPVLKGLYLEVQSNFGTRGLRGLKLAFHVGLVFRAYKQSKTTFLTSK